MVENSEKWNKTIAAYRTYIRLEKHLADNSVEAYTHDIVDFEHFILRQFDVPPTKVESFMIERYLAYLFDNERKKSSQARILSGIKSFYNYLLLNDKIESSPTEFVEAPKVGRHLPDVLTVEEIDTIISSIDPSTPKGRRDRAMLELLYSCGLRVTMAMATLHPTLWATSSRTATVLFSTSRSTLLT
ncbi:MAG: site-specific integrase, partial [Alistipes sp.]|nr:site-specific integrase [Alistipes sp.]